MTPSESTSKWAVLTLGWQALGAALLAAVSLAWAPAGAQAAEQAIPPSAHVQAMAVHPNPSRPPGLAVHSVPLRVVDPAAYARAKEAASARGAAQQRRLSASRQATTSRPQTALFAGLNASGLSAAQETSQFGASADTTPPDTTGAIGPTQYIEIVNSELAIYDRTNLSMIGSPVALDMFTGGMSTCDPQMKYDPQSQRWFYIALRCDGTKTNNQLYFGWSKTTNPLDLTTSSWCSFAVSSTPATSLDDYPKLGLDTSHLIIGSNLFDASSGAFRTAHILVAAKPAAGTISSCGSPPTFTVFGSRASPLMTSIGNQAFTPEPATLADTASTTGYVVAADFNDFVNMTGDHLALWEIGGTASSPTLVDDGDLAVPSFAVPPAVPQPGSSDQIDSLDGRLTQAVAAEDPNASNAEAVWTQHTIASGSGGSVVRWYEIVPSATTKVRQSGMVSDPAGFAFNGAIAPTLNGGAVTAYDTGGSNQTVVIKAQSRIPSAPLGGMFMAITLASSSAVDSDFSCPSQGGTSFGDTSCRWGDYSVVSVDPNNPDVVWGSNQIDGPSAGGNAHWATQNFALTPTDVPPTGSFAISPNPAPPGSAVTVDASGSTDPDGMITNYSWDFGDGSTGTGLTATHTYAATGTYTVTLTVTDNGGQTSSTTHSVTVAGPLSAAFTVLPNPAPAGTPISLDASGSTDPGATITSYSWNFGDGGTGAGSATSHSYAAAGTYVIALTVSDGYGESATTTRTVTVVGPPSGSFTASANPSPVGSPIHFDASGSTDPGTSITSYSWNFGDGSTGTGSATTHSFAAAGTYIVTLTVADNFGRMSATSHAVSVVGPPTASFTNAPSPAIAGAPISFNASSSTDPGASITTYSWNFGDGLAGSGTNPRHSYSASGTYTVTLTVSDAYHEEASTRHTLTVKPRLRGSLAIAKKQKLSSVLKRGLVVLVSANESTRAVFAVTTSLRRQKNRTSTSLMLLRDGSRSVSAGRHRISLKLPASAIRKLGGQQTALVNVRVTFTDSQRQTLTLSAAGRLTA